MSDIRKNMIDTSGSPSIDDLLKRLRISPKDGRIWLDDQRMIMMHVGALSALRRQLIDLVGITVTRALLAHVGYTSGTLDAGIARRVRAEGNPYHALLVGPQLHALEGMLFTRPLKVEIDVTKGQFYGEFEWHDSAEVDAHVALYGISADPVCWMGTGYASGYATAFMGRQIQFREVKCRAMGAPHCLIVGRPADEWESLEKEGKGSGGSGGPCLPLSRITDHRHAPNRLMKGLVGVSSGFVSVCHMLEKVANTNATVLLLGETGVGKEMFARALHRLSPRAQNDFIAINCAAIPENLIEAELFGVEKGAFTGAVASRPGRFERANAGTLFLDEVGMLNLPAQGKLLRALQEREIERVGDTQVRKVDVRVVAATNEDLDKAVKAGRFREDLLFRLNIFPVHIPPLRERRDDIPVLMGHFLKKFNDLHKRNATGFTERTVDALLQYPFPGNIRELENMIERAVILADGDAPLDISHLFVHASSFLSDFLKMGADGIVEGKEQLTDFFQPLADKIFSEQIPLEAIEKAVIEIAMARSDGNLAQAGRLLGISRAQVAYRLKEK